jgi:DNA-binding transcriptional ArsR family regulator
MLGAIGAWNVLPLRSTKPAFLLLPVLRLAMDALAEYFKVFSEPNRLAVLDALRQGPLNVTAVVERTGLSQALVSKHLKLLTIAGVVKRRPEGSLVFYEVIDRSVFRLLAQAEKQLLASRRLQLDALAAIL